MKILPVSIAVLVFATIALGQATNPAKQSPSPAVTFHNLKSLVSEWEGEFTEGGQQLRATTSFRLVSDGSVLMNVIGAGT